MRHSFLLPLLLISAPLLAQAPPLTPPPATPVRPVVDDYFGVKVTDPYRYLENLSNPEVQTWFKAQADYADKYLTALPTRAQFAKDITKYVNSTPAAVHDVSRTLDGRYFIQKILPNQNTAKLYTREKLSAKEIILVDPDHFAGPKGEPAAINYFSPSNDGRYVAVGISIGGSEDAVIHIIDSATGKELPETIDRAEYGGVEWQSDNHSFCYVRLQKLAPNAPETDKYMNPAAYLHQLNTSPDTDRKIMQDGVSDRVPMTPVDGPGVSIQPDSHYMIGQIQHGVQNEQTLYSAPLASLDQPGEKIPWVKFCDIDDQIDQFAVHGDDVFLLSHKGAPHFKILKTSLANPDLAHATVVVPAGDAIIRGIDTAADALYVRQIQDGVTHILRVPYDGTAATEVPLPFYGDAEFLESDPRQPGIIFFLGAWTKGDRVCEYDPATNIVTTTDIAPPGPFDNRDDITSVEVKVPSYDGALVPLSIIYKKDMKQDGSNPVALEAYGAYGISIDPYFSRSMLAWLDRGGIYCIAHVRGGGELGQDWYKAGYKLTKPNTWRDVIACSQYLIDQKYTSSSHLGIFGGSAGGITMSRSVTERPDLFAAVCIQVGCCNALRMENSANGPNNIPEFGSTQTQEGFEDCYAMDGTQHVRAGVAYPAVMLTTGMNDPRVDSWEPGKMAAHLQTATSSNKPIILRVDFKAGHGSGSSKQQNSDERADMFAFFLAAFDNANAPH
jgi:prolyl oligopeptidase